MSSRRQTQKKKKKKKPNLITSYFSSRRKKTPTPRVPSHPLPAPFPPPPRSSVSKGGNRTFEDERSPTPPLPRMKMSTLDDHRQRPRRVRSSSSSPAVGVAPPKPIPIPIPIPIPAPTTAPSSRRPTTTTTRPRLARLSRLRRPPPQPSAKKILGSDSDSDSGDSGDDSDDPEFRFDSDEGSLGSDSEGEPEPEEDVVRDVRDVVVAPSRPRKRKRGKRGVVSVSMSGVVDVDALIEEEEEEEEEEQERSPKRRKKNESGSGSLDPSDPFGLFSFRGVDDDRPLPISDASRRRLLRSVLRISIGKDAARHLSQDDDEQQRQPKGRGRGRRRQKETPLEKQVSELLKSYPNHVLLIQVGYKYTVFGPNAPRAAKILQLGCYRPQGGKFMKMSFPISRLSFHLERLVSAGLKCGVVSQRETAAIKKSELAGRRRKVFKRTMERAYTLGTFVADDVAVGDGRGDSDVSSQIRDDRFIVGVWEENGARIPHMILVGVEVSTGNLLWDEWEEPSPFLRRELHSRLVLLKPVEVLLIVERPNRGRAVMSGSSRPNPEQLRRCNVSLETQKVVGLCPFVRRTESIWAARVARDVDQTGSATETAPLGDRVENFVDEEDEEPSELPRQVRRCIATLRDYLIEFKLECVLRLSKPRNLNAKAARHMKLNGISLWNLEVLQSRAAPSRKGPGAVSLIAFLDRTRTLFGRRLLQRWVSNPLRRVPEIEVRQKAVTYLLGLLRENQHSPLLAFHEKTLRRIPDLERLFHRVVYRRVSPSILLSSLLSLQDLFAELKPLKDMAISDAFVAGIVRNIPYRSFVPEIAKLLSSFDHEAAKKNLFQELFLSARIVSAYPKIAAHKVKIDQVKKELRRHLCELRRILKNPRLEYKTVLKSTHLVEVENRLLPRLNIPDDWEIVSKTKKMARLSTPYAKARVAKMAYHYEHVQSLSLDVWSDLLDSFAKQYGLMRALVDQLAVLDCLFSLALVALQEGYCCPKFVPRRCLELRGFRHPIVEHHVEQFVTNDVLMSEGNCEGFVVTGPNMGGKSVFIKGVALVTLMAHVGSYVPAASCVLCPFDCILTRMGAYDDLTRSTFEIEAMEASTILNEATPNSLVILDELGRGTSTHDGTAIAYASLRHIVEHRRCFCLFVTHYPEVTTLERRFPSRLKNLHMDYVRDGSSITFLYHAVPGVADDSYGLNVAKMSAMPEGVLNRARMLKSAVASRHRRVLLDTAFRRLVEEKEDQVDELVDLAELQHSVMYSLRDEDF